VSTSDLSLTLCLKGSKIANKMPIYEYICSKCQSKFELLRPMSQASEGVHCPYCHSQAERVLSHFACFSKDKSGLTSSVGGSPCSSCRAVSCDSCEI